MGKPLAIPVLNRWVWLLLQDLVWSVCVVLWDRIGRERRRRRKGVGRRRDWIGLGGWESGGEGGGEI